MRDASFSRAHTRYTRSMRRYGNVRLLPSGRYQARIRPRRGAHITAPRTFDSEDEALAWLDAMERRRDHQDNWSPDGAPLPKEVTRYAR